MNRVPALLGALLLAVGPGAHAAVRYFDIAGATAPAENACPAWIPESTLDDCSFNASNPTGLATAQWIGPVFSAGYYAPGNAPSIFTNGSPPSPVVAPAPVLPVGGKSGIPIARGFLAIDDRDTAADPTDDIVTGTIEFGAFERNVGTGPASRVVESFGRIIHRINAPPASASNVSGATANGNGGFDYVLGISEGAATFPTAIAGATTAAGGFADDFPSEVASQSTGDSGDVPYWAGAGTAGIARFEGATATAGVRTGATVWDYDCTSASGACTTSTEVNWNADSRAGYDNVLLRFSTDGSGNIASAEAYLVNESDLSAAAAGTDSWQATTLAFTGAEDSTPEAYDDRALVINGLDLSAIIAVLGNDVPGASPQVVTIETPPAHGTATVLTSPPSAVNIIDYVPAGTAFEGVDTFTYRVTDGNSQTAVGTVAVTLTDPISCTTDTANGLRDTPLVLDVLANDAGYDLPPVVVTIATAPSGGTAAVGADNRITFTPPAGATGFFTFAYTINDGTFEPATCGVTVNVEGEVAVDDTATAEDFVAVNLAVLANDRREVLAAPIGIEITSPPSHGAAIVLPATAADLAQVRYIADAGFTGADSFDYRLRDAGGYVSNEATVTITVSDTAPTAVDDADTVEDGVATTIQVAQNDTGRVDTPLTIEVVTAPAHGTANANEATGGGLPTVTYTGNPGFTGSDSFTYTLTDADGDVSNVATVSILVEDSVPVAVGDTFNGDDRAQDRLFVLNNDTGLVDYPFTLEITQAPTLGTATVLPASTTGTGLPEIGYASAAGSSGTDTLQYTVRDADGDVSAPATVTIQVTNATPAAVDDTRSVEDGSTLAINVLGNDNGRNNGPLTLAITQQPASGTATIITATGLATPTISYRPDAGFTGTDTFRYTFTDGDGDTSNEALVTLNVADSMPVANADAVSIDDRTGFSIDVLQNDTGLSDGPLTVAITSPPANGTATLVTVVAGAATRPGISYASNTGFAGTDTVRYRVTDRDGDVSNEATLTLTVANPAPVAVDDRGGDNGLLPFGETFVVERIKTALDVVRNDTGRSNRPLTITITQQPAHGIAEVDSVEVTGIGRPGISYRSDAGYVGPESFRYRITDADGEASNEATVSFDVVAILTATNDGSPYPLATNRDRPIVVDVLANDGGMAYGLVQVEVVTEVNGTATVNADNTITFRPTPGFTGRFPSPDCQPANCFATAGGGFRYRLTDASNQVAEGVAFVDVFPPPVDDQGGSSALDGTLLGLLAGAAVLRMRPRGRRPRRGAGAATAPGARNGEG
jgi:hypothetical protein